MLLVGTPCFIRGQHFSVVSQEQYCLGLRLLRRSIRCSCRQGITDVIHGLEPALALDLSNEKARDSVIEVIVRIPHDVWIHRMEGDREGVELAYGSDGQHEVEPSAIRRAPIDRANCRAGTRPQLAQTPRPVSHKPFTVPSPVRKTQEIRVGIP
jgi:hypothetical protein